VKNEDIVIDIYTPAEMRQLLAHTLPNMIPFTVIAGFCMVRHEEMCAVEGLPRLDWRDINFEKREIFVPKEVARKINIDRIIPMPENLVKWLLPYREESGPVCRLGNASNALARAVERANKLAKKGSELKLKDNGLRKSAISYRLAVTQNIGRVAEEAGNSPGMIKKNYRRALNESAGKAWYEIEPPEVLQLDLFRKMVG
jgi:integrase